VILMFLFLLLLLLIEWNGSEDNMYSCSPAQRKTRRPVRRTLMAHVRQRAYYLHLR
jgi:hypothetical protein